MENIYYHGDQIFLYANFEGVSVLDPKVCVIKTIDSPFLLDWTDMKKINVNEYYYDDYYIPYNIGYGTYQVIYKAIVDGKEALFNEEFNVLFKPEEQNQLIKVYGYVHKDIKGTAISDVKITIFNIEQNRMYYECQTSKMGLWEAYLEPGRYKFIFNKFGFNVEEIETIIDDSQEVLQFNNVTLSSIISDKLGKGNFVVYDKYTTKEGYPLVGLNIEAYKIDDIQNLYAATKTDSDGKWELYVDVGIYLLKIKGVAYNQNYDLKFRLKVTETEFKFEDITNNKTTGDIGLTVGRGNGSILLKDEVIDHNGRPIVDVLVQAFSKNDLNILLAQDYTNVNGEWQLYLDPGNYQIEFFHPEFNLVVEDRIVK